MEDHKKLRDIDDKLAVIRNAKFELGRLEDFLTAQRAQVAEGIGREYLGRVSISQADIDAQIQHVQNLLRRWR